MPNRRTPWLGVALTASLMLVSPSPAGAVQQSGSSVSASDSLLSPLAGHAATTGDPSHAPGRSVNRDLPRSNVRSFFDVTGVARPLSNAWAEAQASVSEGPASLEMLPQPGEWLLLMAGWATILIVFRRYRKG